MAVKAYFSPEKCCSDELQEDNRGTVCEVHRRKALGKPLSLVGVPALQQCHQSTQGTNHPHPSGCSVTQSHPLLWVTASASPQRREMHIGEECQDNCELSRSEKG